MKYNKFLLGLLTTVTLLSFGMKANAYVSTEAKLQFNKGVDYWQLGQLEEAATRFKYAIDEDPNYIDAYYNLGLILMYMKQDEAALSVFKQIILRKPDDYDAVYQTAILSEKLGQYDKAKMYLSLIPKDSLQAAQARKMEKDLDEKIELAKAEQVEETLETSSDKVQQNTQNEEVTLQQANETQNTNEEIATTTETVDTQTSKKILEQPTATTFITANPNANCDGVYKNISSPTGMVTGNDGNLYVAGFSDNTIYKILPNGSKLVYIKSEKIDGPIGIAFDDAQNLYIANYNKNNVLKVDKTGAITTFIDKIGSPYYMHISEGLLFVSSQGDNSIIRKKL